jgi:hypothetical protein
MYMYLHTMYIVSNIHLIHLYICVHVYVHVFPQCAWTYGHFVLYVHAYMYIMYMYTIFLEWSPL